MPREVERRRQNLLRDKEVLQAALEVVDKHFMACEEDEEGTLEEYEFYEAFKSLRYCIKNIEGKIKETTNEMC